jgi:hypothetical protein
MRLSSASMSRSSSARKPSWRSSASAAGGRRGSAWSASDARVVVREETGNRAARHQAAMQIAWTPFFRRVHAHDVRPPVHCRHSMSLVVAEPHAGWQSASG